MHTRAQQSTPSSITTPSRLTSEVGSRARRRQLCRHRAEALCHGSADSGVTVAQRAAQQAQQLAQQGRLQHGSPVYAALRRARLRRQRQAVPAAELAGLGCLRAGGVQQRGQHGRLHLLR